MPGKIYNRLRVLLAAKAEKEQRNIPLKEVERKSGISWSTLQSWANNRVSRFDVPVIIALCDYLDCEIGELIIYERDI